MGFKVNNNALDCHPPLWMWHHFVSTAAGEPTKQSYKAVVSQSLVSSFLSFQSPQVLF